MASLASEITRYSGAHLRQRLGRCPDEIASRDRSNRVVVTVEAGRARGKDEAEAVGAARVNRASPIILCYTGSVYRLLDAFCVC